MIHNQEAISQQQMAPKNTWISFHLSEMSKGVSQGATVLMGHHLFVFAHGAEDSSKHWMIDLQNNRVQTASGYYYFGRNEKYSMNKYGENQIIKFGGEQDKRATNELILVTIDSFDPLEIRSETITDKNAPRVSGHTAAIYEDCLFVFGGRNTGIETVGNNRLYCYDLSILTGEKASLIFQIEKRTWKLCETSGEGPQPKEGAKSFIKNDNLYIYGGLTRNGKNKVNYSELFKLNLKSMKWRKIGKYGPNRPDQGSTFFGRFSVDIYGDNMLILKNETKDESDKLYCCNLNDLDESWSTIDVEGLRNIRTIGNSVIYKNVMYICTTKNAANNQLFLAALQLDDLSLPKSPEQEQLSSMFLNESEADLHFKVHDKTIPAHKKVLIQKSPFFANVFTGLPEQKAIEIYGRKDKTFKRFLQYLYCGTVDANLLKTARLLLLAGQYQQEDLYFKCVNILVRNMTSDNVCWMFDFACERGIILLKDWCIKFFQYRTGFDDIIKWGGYLQNQTKNRELIEVAVDSLLKNLLQWQYSDRKALRFIEDFLTQNVSIQNIVKLSEHYLHYHLQLTNLRDAVLNFVDTNLQSIQEQGLDQKLHKQFELAFSIYKKKQRANSTSTQDDNISVELEEETESTSEVNHKDKKDKAQRKGKKRMDPSSHCNEEQEGKTGPVLKKNKQSSRNFLFYL